MYGEIKGCGIAQLGALVAELTRQGLTYRVSVGSEACPDNMTWVIEVTGY